MLSIQSMPKQMRSSVAVTVLVTIAFVTMWPQQELSMVDQLELVKVLETEEPKTFRVAKTNTRS